MLARRPSRRRRREVSPASPRHRKRSPRPRAFARRLSEHRPRRIPLPYSTRARTQQCSLREPMGVRCMEWIYDSQSRVTVRHEHPIARRCDPVSCARRRVTASRARRAFEYARLGTYKNRSDPMCVEIRISRYYQIPNHSMLTHKVLHVVCCTCLYITNNAYC
jgi:hypothetical protein